MLSCTTTIEFADHREDRQHPFQSLAMAVNKLELLVLGALFTAPCAMILAKCAESPSLFALHPAANALAFLVFFPASVASESRTNC